MTFTTSPSSVPSSTHDGPAQDYVHHSSGQRVNTDIVICEALRQQYPQLTLTVTPNAFCNLLSFAAAGHATITALPDTSSPLNASLKWRRWIAPPRRTESVGVLTDDVIFGKYVLKWQQAPGAAAKGFLLYIVSGRDGACSYPNIANNYILSPASERPSVDALIAACSAWMVQLHREVLVYDGGYWQKSRELWDSVQGSRWADVILDPGMKARIVADVQDFFAARETYARLHVPWKRGVIYHGPPGNGKTVSIKAMMHSLSARADQDGGPIPTLYVKSLASFAGPEYSVKQIFAKARQQAPCYLVFEDLDSLVTDGVRSYFLNEVDGLRSNDGIFMVGSTNHLDRLDPGIAKRPSRFDRKYLFPNPDAREREMYCGHWQGKLEGSDDVEFPDELRPAIAGITEGFSFAYMQEAFVASLLAIARGNGKDGDGASARHEADKGNGAFVREEDGGEHPELDKFALWVEIKKQVKALREGLEDAKRANGWPCKSVDR